MQSNFHFEALTNPPIYVELHRHTNLYINIICLKIGNMYLYVELKAILVVNIDLKLTEW